MLKLINKELCQRKHLLTPKLLGDKARSNKTKLGTKNQLNMRNLQKSRSR